MAHHFYKMSLLRFTLPVLSVILVPQIYFTDAKPLDADDHAYLHANKTSNSTTTMTATADLATIENKTDSAQLNPASLGSYWLLDLNGADPHVNSTSVEKSDDMEHSESIRNSRAIWISRGWGGWGGRGWGRYGGYGGYYGGYRRWGWRSPWWRYYYWY